MVKNGDCPAGLYSRPTSEARRAILLGAMQFSICCQFKFFNFAAVQYKILRPTSDHITILYLLDHVDNIMSNS